MVDRVSPVQTRGPEFGTLAPTKYPDMPAIQHEEAETARCLGFADQLGWLNWYALGSMNTVEREYLRKSHNANHP